MTARRALLTGITGQDGSYLAELLLRKGYEVHGIVRRSSSFNTGRLDGIYQDPHVPDYRLQLHYGDLVDSSVLGRILHTVKPDEVYNLAAQSHVRVSFDMPAYTFDVVAQGTARLLEVVRELGPKTRFYQASSSEMFGSSAPPQAESTPFRPCSPYAIAKVAAHHTTVLYRESYGLFAVSGILFNHESPRRGETFVTRKVTRAAARIKLGLQDRLFLGNLEARRDWGFAGDYVEAMWLMLQNSTPTDYVIGTNTAYQIRDACRIAFARVGLGWEKYVVSDQVLMRPTEITPLKGDYSKAKAEMGWEPHTTFEQLINLMVDADLQRFK